MYDVFIFFLYQGIACKCTTKNADNLKIPNYYSNQRVSGATEQAFGARMRIERERVGAT